MTHLKLEGVTNGRIDATAYRTILREEEGRFKRLGRVPNPASGRKRVTQEVLSARPWKRFLEGVFGTFSALTVRRLSETALVATTGQWLLASRDDGATWSVRRNLPDSSGPKGVLPTAICRHRGDCYLGEYPLAHDAVPRLLRSSDDGWTWEVIREFPKVRHLHAVQSDPYSDDLWITTGDRDAACRIGRLRGRDGDYEAIGSGSQRWRAVELAFTPKYVLWGMDSVYSTENEVLKLERSAIGRPDPAPETVCSLDDSVFYSAALDVDGERWVVFSTGAEPGRDSTAPPDNPTDNTPGTARVVTASSKTGFDEWYELGAYRRRQDLGAYWNPQGLFPRASAYVHLATDPDRGIVINPYNTASDNGSLLVVSPSALQKRASRSARLVA